MLKNRNHSMLPVIMQGRSRISRPVRVVAVLLILLISLTASTQATETGLSGGSWGTLPFFLCAVENHFLDTELV